MVFSNFEKVVQNKFEIVIMSRDLQLQLPL